MSIATPLDHEPFTQLLNFIIDGQERITAAYGQDSASSTIKDAVEKSYFDGGDYPDGETSQCHRQLRKYLPLYNAAKNEANRAGLLGIYLPRLERLKAAFETYYELLNNNFMNLYNPEPEPDEDHRLYDGTESRLELFAAIAELRSALPTSPPASVVTAATNPSHWAVTMARDALQEGYRVIADRLNRILMVKRAPLIVADPIRPVDSIDKSIRALRQCMPSLQTMSPGFVGEYRDIHVWTLGFINGKNNKQIPVTMADDAKSVEFHLEFLAGKSRAHWTVAEWVDCIQGPVMEFQRASLEKMSSIESRLAMPASSIFPDQFQFTANVSALRTMIRELRKQYAAAAPYNPPEKLRAVWTELRRIGLAPGELPVKKLTASVRFSKELGNYLDQTPEDFHQALNEAERLIDAAYPVMNSIPQAPNPRRILEQRLERFLGIVNEAVNAAGHLHWNLRCSKGGDLRKYLDSQWQSLQRYLHDARAANPKDELITIIKKSLPSEREPRTITTAGGSTVTTATWHEAGMAYVESIIGKIVDQLSLKPDANADATLRALFQRANPKPDDDGCIPVLQFGMERERDAALVYLERKYPDHSITIPSTAVATPITTGAAIAETDNKAHASRGKGDAVEKLIGWREILAAIKRPYGDESIRQIKRLNELNNGPIPSPGRGAQVIVDKAKLLEWWNGIEKRDQEIADRQQNSEASTSDTYKHGRSAVVVPEISGSIKQKKSKGNKS